MKDMRFAIRLIAMIMAALVLFVAATYVITIHINGDRWINRANNTRLRDAKKTTVQGSVYDSAGVLLAGSSKPGERHYISDERTRRALSHTIGEQTNMSATGVENFHATTLLGFTTTRTGYTLQRLQGQDPVGNNITLTVNAELTRYIADSFKDWKNGAAVVINYKTGAILAMVSIPNFDPANMDLAVQDTAYYNRVLQKRYAPGSTFKIITLASALTNDETIKEEQFSCSGVWNYGEYSLRCAGSKAHGEMSLVQAFADSCNVTFGSIAYQLGAEKLRGTAENFGFNFDFSFDDVIVNQSNCLNKGEKSTDLIQAGIGQGTTEVTPLHMAMIAGAIANGGDMMEPKLIKKVTNPSGFVISEMEPEVFLHCLDEDTSRDIAKYMYETVRGGTATRAAIKGYEDGYVCGKTGSAEWTNDKTRETNAWYVGFLYGDSAHPYAIAVVVEEGGSGGAEAAPIASKVLKKAIELDVY
ncbi:MAG: penicillin-binding protein 2 [Clostridia bacterium]|nr:penicillin-binding protein 2 [Clostridia bacterium]